MWRCLNLQHVWIWYPPKHILVHISANNALILLKFGFLIRTPRLNHSWSSLTSLGVKINSIIHFEFSYLGRCQRWPRCPWNLWYSWCWWCTSWAGKPLRWCQLSRGVEVGCSCDISKSKVMDQNVSEQNSHTPCRWKQNGWFDHVEVLHGKMSLHSNLNPEQLYGEVFELT